MISVIAYCQYHRRKTYQAETGMTWIDWFKSEYNTLALSKTTSVFKQMKERYVVPRRVQDVIPIRRIWKDGIFLVGNCYTKTYQFNPRLLLHITHRLIFW